MIRTLEISSRRLLFVINAFVFATFTWDSTFRAAHLFQTEIVFMVDLKEDLFQGLDDCLTKRNINSCTNVVALCVSVIHGYMDY
jgi:hypothetical protein